MAAFDKLLAGCIAKPNTSSNFLSCSSTPTNSHKAFEARSNEISSIHDRELGTIAGLSAPLAVSVHSGQGQGIESQGEVRSVGPGARDEHGGLVKPDLEVGDRILFGKWSGTEVTDRWRRAVDHEGIRHHGRARGRGEEQE